MNRIVLLAGGSLLLLAAPAFAQDATDSPVAPPAESTLPDAPAEPAPAPSSEETLGAPEPGLDTGAEADVSTGTTTDTTADATTATDAAPGQFTDTQITGFVRAMTAIQALPGDNASKQAQAVEIVTEAGIDAATYNAIGTTMQTDPALADRVRTAMAAEQGATGV
jgi:hypothetical protein